MTTVGIAKSAESFQPEEAKDEESVSRLHSQNNFSNFLNKLIK
ncbi:MULTISPECIES: hypothetical protein [Nostoc]|nr:MULTISPECIES: hypothetical protein [Nostoc]